MKNTDYVSLYSQITPLHHVQNFFLNSIPADITTTAELLTLASDNVGEAFIVQWIDAMCKCHHLCLSNTPNVHSREMSKLKCKAVDGKVCFIVYPS